MSESEPIVNGAKPAASVAKDGEEAATYERPQVKTLSQADVLSAVTKGSKFPARGFSG
jgi:hypothetical protein